MPFQIKICGVTTVDDAIFAVQNGADAIGLNFYEKSSRYVCPPGHLNHSSNADVTKDDATKIVDSVRQLAESQSGTAAKIVGVFVNLNPKQVVAIASRLGLDGIQLHGDEPVSDLAEIRELMGPKSSELLVRAVRTNPSSNHQSEPEQEIVRIETEINQWAQAGVDAVLLDAAVAGEFGGTGKSVDWFSVPKITSPVPIILAGGLTSQNVAEAIRCSQAHAVDVASGVESGPGKKDDLLVAQFIESARVALNRQ